MGGVAQSIDKVFSFNPESLTFTPMSERIPIAVHLPGIVQIDNKILLVGGTNKYGTQRVPLDGVYEMDPQTGKWTDTGLKTPASLNAPEVTVLYNA